MKVFNKIGGHVKTTPVRYAIINNITDYLSDFDHKRLSKQERQDLEDVLFWETIPTNLKKVFNMNKVMDANKVITRECVYYTITFDKLEVSCTYSVYLMMPIKKVIKRLY